MNQEVITTICWLVVIAFGVQSFSTYAIVRLLVTGRSMFDRREREHEPARVTSIGARNL